MKWLVDRIAASARVLLGVWFSSAFIGMFFEKRFPFLHPYIFWTFRIYLGALVVSLIGLMVVAPGFLMAEDLHSEVHDSRASQFEKRLTWMWCAGGGLLFTVINCWSLFSYSFEIWGGVTDIKVWFVVLCWTAVMVPYAALGYFVRRFMRRNRDRQHDDYAFKPC
jgi:hypothetical protein